MTSVQTLVLGTQCIVFFSKFGGSKFLTPVESVPMEGRVTKVLSPPRWKSFGPRTVFVDFLGFEVSPTTHMSTMGGRGSSDNLNPSYG